MHTNKPATLPHMLDRNRVNRILAEESIQAIMAEAAERFRKEESGAPLLGAPYLTDAEYDLDFYGDFESAERHEWARYDRDMADAFFPLDFNADNAFTVGG